MTQTVRQLISDLGGNAAVAKATGYSEGAVALWVHRKRIPRTAWPEMQKAFEPVTLDMLLALEKATGAATEAANDATPNSEAA